MKRRWRQMAREIGFTQVSASHEVEPLIKLIGRGDTTVVDAYLSPVLRRYVDKVVAGLARCAGQLFFMQSNGGLTERRRFRGKDAILSGPAGGIVGMARTAAEAGFDACHRLRHGRHLDRRLPLCRRLRADQRDGGGGRAGAGADAGDPHGRGGRRLGLPSMTGALPGRAGQRRARCPGRPATGAAGR